MTDEASASIFTAIEASDLAAVRNLLRADPKLLESTCEDGMTPLMVAVLHADSAPEMVQLLVDAGADVTAATPEGVTALHLLIDINAPPGSGELLRQIAQMLIAAGADLEARQHWGWTPLLRAIVEGTDDELQAYADVGAKVNLHFPADTFPEFLSGLTALMAAVSSPSKTAILLAAGADSTMCGMNDQSPLEFALQCLQDYDDDPEAGHAIEETAASAVQTLLDQLQEDGIDLDAEEDGLTVRQTVEEMLKASVEEARKHDYRGDLLKTIALLEAAELGL